MAIKSFVGDFSFLSNFHRCKIPVGGLVFPCVENAFQSCKTADPNKREQFCNINPRDAKKLGRKVKLRNDWESKKVHIMYSLLYIKFATHEDLRTRLIATQGMMLVEGNTWNDRYWGVCKGTGENMLGKLLMDLRSAFIRAPVTNTPAPVADVPALQEDSSRQDISPKMPESLERGAHLNETIPTKVLAQD